jgi:transposase
MPKNLDGYKKNVETLPLIKHYLSELGIYELLKKYVEKGRSQEEPAEGLSLLIMNILSSNQPLYKVEEWLQTYQDEFDEFGKESLALNKEVLAFNDDRFARNLDKLYQADRGSLMAELSAKAIEIHELETKIIHNDSTTVTFSGEYNLHCERDTIQLKRGYNKDGRPDCKQIVFGLNITEDGHVPISYQVYDGNTSDTNTHQVNFRSLRGMIQEEQFIYVADSKLCTLETLNYLDSKGGQFISILPKNRLEVKAFHEKLRCGEVLWKKTLEVPNSRKRNEKIIYFTLSGETTREGYPILWVRSSAKAINDNHQRQKKVQASEHQKISR